VYIYKVWHCVCLLVFKQQNWETDRTLPIIAMNISKWNNQYPVSPMHKGVNAMKKFTLGLVAAAISMSSCSSGRMVSRDYDDVYYSNRDVIVEDERRNNERDNSSDYQQESTVPDNYTAPDDNVGSSNETNVNSGSGDNDRFRYDSAQPDNTYTERDRDGNTYVTNNYYEDDDYYDYAYSARIRRFYHPVGWSYYDPFYTNLYWYDYNPTSWGVSLYCTYNWWRPNYYSYWGWNNWGWNTGWGVGFGWGNGWGTAWNNPYYGGWGFNNGYWNGFNNGYWNGYNQGYWNGYYAGLYNGSFNPYYFNSLDNYSYYYGPRGRSAVAGNVPGGRNVGEIYGRSIAENPKNPRNYAALDGTSAMGRPKREIRSLDSEIATPRGNNSAPGKPRISGGETRSNSDVVTPKGNDPKSNPRSDENYTPRSNDPKSNPRSNDNYTPRSNDPKSNPPSNDNYTPRSNDP